MNATNPSIVDVLTGFIPQVAGITLDFHPTIMPQWAEGAVSVLKMAEEGKLDPFVLIVEGSIPDEELAKKRNGFWCTVGEEKGQLVTFNDWFSRLSKKTVAVVAAGSCASYGGGSSRQSKSNRRKGDVGFSRSQLEECFRSSSHLRSRLSGSWGSSPGIPRLCCACC